jgi:hypothetical protein
MTTTHNSSTTTTAAAPDSNNNNNNHNNWMIGKEYATETIRSLTATEESDVYRMNAPGLLKMLACVAVGVYL